MVHVNQQALICFWGSTWTVLSYYRFVTTSSNIILAVHRWWAHIKLRYWLIWHDFWPLAIESRVQSMVQSRVQSPGFVLSPIDITQDFPLSSELQGRDIGMVSYDAILYASLETRVARYYNNWSCCRIYLVHRLFLSILVHLTRIIVREQCPFAMYSTYLTHRWTPSPCSMVSCSYSYSMCTTCIAHRWLSQGITPLQYCANW